MMLHCRLVANSARHCLKGLALSRTQGCLHPLAPVCNAADQPTTSAPLPPWVQQSKRLSSAACRAVLVEQPSTTCNPPSAQPLRHSLPAALHAPPFLAQPLSLLQQLRCLQTNKRSSGAGTPPVRLTMPKSAATSSRWASSPLHLRYAHPPTFEVVEFSPKGFVCEHMQARTAEQLGLHPRDVSLFAADHRLTQQRATISCRDGVLLFKTEAVKAIIRADKAILFKCRRDVDTNRIKETMLHLLRDPQLMNPEYGLPFELCVLEVLLHETVHYFERRTHHLNMMLESSLADIRYDKGPLLNSEESLALGPIQKLLTTISSDVKETGEAINHILDDDKNLEAICLTERHAEEPEPMPTGSFNTGASPMGSADLSCGDMGQDQLDRMAAAAAELGSAAEAVPMNQYRERTVQMGQTEHMKLAATMLETYERQVQSIQSILREMAEHLDNASNLWHMQLDGARNHIILVNLYLSLVSIAIMLAAVPAALLGMNLESGLPESDSRSFWGVTAGSIALGLVAVPAGKAWYVRQWHHARHSQQARQLRQLRLFLVQHIDDIEDISNAVKGVQGGLTKDGFQRLLQEALRGRKLSRASSDFLYRCFDTNRDGFLTEAELVRSYDMHQRCDPEGGIGDTSLVPGHCEADNGNGSLFSKLRLFGRRH